MAENITLGTVSTFTNDSSAVSTVNNNSALITAAFQNVVDRNGTLPNAMNAVLDMNSFNIINLPSPATVNSPARLVDVVSNPTITVPPTGTSGSTVPLLNGNNTWSGSQNFSGATVTLPSNPGFNSIILNGSVSGTTTVQPGSTTPPNNILSLPTTTDTLIGQASTATLTNKTYDTGGTGNIFKINGTSITSVTGSNNVVLSTSPAITTPTISQPIINGVTDASSAAAGVVGEVINSTIASASAISVTTATLFNLTSISLTAGDWEIYGSIQYINAAGASTLTSLGAGISTTTANFDTTLGGRTTLVGCGGSTWNGITQSGASGAIQVGTSTPTVRITSNSTQTIFLNGFIVSTGTITAFGNLHARRMR
jgi:hypothetical protein